MFLTKNNIDKTIRSEFANRKKTGSSVSCVIKYESDANLNAQKSYWELLHSFMLLVFCVLTLLIIFKYPYF